MGKKKGKSNGKGQGVKRGKALRRELAARQAILDACLRYCRGVDRFDSELTKSAYFPDATDDHGAFKGNAHEFADVVNQGHAARWSSTMHVIANHSVDLDLERDVAHGETYVVAYLRRRDESAVDAVGGRYIDRFECRDGEWRIADRVYIWEWSSALDAKASLVEGAGFTHGTRSRDDLSYRR